MTETATKPRRTPPPPRRGPRPAPERPAYRRERVERCGACAKGTPVLHDPSRFCSSGKRNHCTCDTCF